MNHFSCKNGNFVVAVYDSKFYFGKLIEYDDTDYYVDYCAYWELFEAVPLAKQTGHNMGQSWLNLGSSTCSKWKRWTNVHGF